MVMEGMKKQWYEENHELFETEKAAMEMLAKDDDKELKYLDDGRAYWIVGFNSRLSGDKFTVALVYPMNHPYGTEIPDIRVYPLKPSYEEMLEKMNDASGRKDHSLPYSMRESSGLYALAICNPKWTV